MKNLQRRVAGHVRVVQRDSQGWLQHGEHAPHEGGKQGRSHQELTDEPGEHARRLQNRLLGRLGTVERWILKSNKIVVEIMVL